MKKMKRFLSLLLVLTLTAAAMSLISCDKTKGDYVIVTDEVTKTITVTVIDKEGIETSLTLVTRGVTLRDALEQQKLIEGDEGEFGLYVKYVDGIRADYDRDGAWWGFYKDNILLPSSIDDTEISDGDSYQIKYEKA